MAIAATRNPAIRFPQKRRSLPGNGSPVIAMDVRMISWDRAAPLAWCVKEIGPALLTQGPAWGADGTYPARSAPRVGVDIVGFPASLEGFGRGLAEVVSVSVSKSTQVKEAIIECGLGHAPVEFAALQLPSNLFESESANERCRGTAAVTAETRLHPSRARPAMSASMESESGFLSDSRIQVSRSLSRILPTRPSRRSAGAIRISRHPSRSDSNVSESCSAGRPEPNGEPSRSSSHGRPSAQGLKCGAVA